MIEAEDITGIPPFVCRYHHCGFCLLEIALLNCCRQHFGHAAGSRTPDSHCSTSGRLHTKEDLCLISKHALSPYVYVV